MTATIARYAEKLAAVGLSFGLEPVSYAEVKTLAQAVRIAKAARQPNIGIVIDSLHLQRVGDTPAAIKPVDPGLFAYAQLCDAPAARPIGAEALADEARRGRLDPGAGELPLNDFLDALPNNIAIEIEVPERSRAHLPVAEQARAAADAAHRFLALRAARGR
jgi:sugar phosphate isomerase/epimerase